MKILIFIITLLFYCCNTNNSKEINNDVRVSSYAKKRYQSAAKYLKLPKDILDSIPVKKTEDIYVPIDTSFSAKKFRKWVKDTLAILDTKNIDPNIDFILSPDSLYWRVVTHYNALIKKNVRYNDAYIKPTLSLLNEHNELPNTDFQLNFDARMDYYPTPIATDKFTYSFEIENLTVRHNKAMYIYSYIRGRLGDKIVHTVDKNGVEKVEYYYFKRDYKNKKYYAIKR